MPRILVAFFAVFLTLLVSNTYSQSIGDFNCGVDGQFCLGSCSYVVCTNGNKVPMPIPAGTICTQSGSHITLNHDTQGVCVGIITGPTSQPTTTATAGPTTTATAGPTVTFTPTAAPTSTGGGSTSAPDRVTLRSISQAGSGCPAGTVSTNVAPDKQAFTLAFTSFIAQIGPGLSPTDSRRNCQINLDLSFPQGFSFAIANVDYRGFANLDSGVVGQQVSHYYFQGQLVTGNSSINIQGPSVGDYLRRDELGLATVVWSPCGGGRSLNINTEVRVYATSSASSNSQGLMTVDSVDGTVQQIYNLRWRSC